MGEKRDAKREWHISCVEKWRLRWWRIDVTGG